ncbi:ribosomal protein S18 acetylase RimI-like enzyme [Frondihabitans sp. PhB188]|uniref:GNAT family N-acetyltransferase n=1 Tax=Frondihabitans sp. PhB188 TaxID=2485200 RepID=UPI000F49244A|nr:GNAT family N-acetyltransferase [Frondihabitans sp. PhB188]ROQ37168.1 ribosomal protein S18 acetylase RimI-like enzyme [Frondihabitans sp. PhB188]
MILFRTATPVDSAAIVELVTSAYRGDASRAGWTTEADLLEGPRIDADILAVDLANPDGRVIVAVEDDRIVACCNVVRRPDGVGYFGMFAVTPTGQGGGLGSRVLAEAERIARDEWHLTEIEMTVIEQRAELIAFYERRAYVRTGGFIPFPYGDERFGVPLRDDLRMAVLRKAI